jgi:peptide/nickel transport system ATP-binding protein
LSAPPYHPYSHLLVSSAPELRAGWLADASERCHRELAPIGPSNDNPELCTFVSRCSMRIDGVCNVTTPSLRTLENGAQVLCHRSEADLIGFQAPVSPLSVEHAERA